MAELVVLVGLPGAGKSTLYRERFAATHDRVSKDLLRVATPPVRGDLTAHELALVDAALAAGRSVVIDDTNARAADRAPFLARARARGVRTIACFVDAPTRLAVARNEARPAGERVPKVAIFVVAKRLERPTRDEGFDDVVHVSAG